MEKRYFPGGVLRRLTVHRTALAENKGDGGYRPGLLLHQPPQGNFVPAPVGAHRIEIVDPDGNVVAALVHSKTADKIGIAWIETGFALNAYIDDEAYRAGLQRAMKGESD